MLICLGLIVWIPISTEVIPEFKLMGWMDKRKWFWISVIIVFYLVLITLIICTWTLPGFILPAK